MAKPMIENSERGITINKALAWTMLVSVAGLIWWGGGTLATLQSAAERASSAQLEARIRVLDVNGRVKVSQRAVQNVATLGLV